MSAPDPEPTDQEEPDGPAEDSLQHFAWNFLSRYSHVDEAREKLDRQTEEEHINEKEMVCVCVCVSLSLCSSAGAGLPSATLQAQELTKLIYLRSQKIKPEQLWEESHNLRPCEMLSFQETKARDNCSNNPGGVLVGPYKCHLRQSFSCPCPYQICCS